jgi:hypothetical protein
MIRLLLVDKNALFLLVVYFGTLENSEFFFIFLFRSKKLMDGNELSKKKNVFTT